MSNHYKNTLRIVQDLIVCPGIKLLLNFRCFTCSFSYWVSPNAMRSWLQNRFQMYDRFCKTCTVLIERNWNLPRSEFFKLSRVFLWPPGEAEERCRKRFCDQADLDWIWWDEWVGRRCLDVMQAAFCFPPSSRRLRHSLIPGTGDGQGNAAPAGPGTEYSWCAATPCPRCAPWQSLQLHL